MRNDQARPIEILLIEDNPGDIVLTTEAFEDARMDVILNAVTNGTEAIELLEKTATANEKLPDLILLDLNLPGIDGHGVLQAIRADDRIRHLPVIIMTTSTAQDDVLSAYRASANSYITKPLDPEEFLDAIRALEQFWLRIVQLPGQPS